MERREKSKIIEEIQAEVVEKLEQFTDRTNHIINPNIDKELVEFLEEKIAFLELLKQFEK